MNEVRIIGGLYRGKIIRFKESTSLRPTPSRVREMLFNWLMHDISNAHCLDLFAGSGALGFEALSRGASSVLLVEEDLKVFQVLKKNALSFPKEPLTLHHKNALLWLRQNKKQFDIIFLDPPFHTTLLDDSLKWIQKTGCLANKGLLYVETGEPFSPDEKIWSVQKSKKTGEVYSYLLQMIAVKTVF